jgi:hypothetical protein
MSKMGSSGFTPLPPVQHKWQDDPRQAPLHRIWSWMVGHTCAFGHMSPYAVSSEGHELHLENAAEDLRMDVANTRRAWRKGLSLGLWRNGTKEEGVRRLYFLGKLKPCS